MERKETTLEDIRRIRRISYLILAVIILVFCLVGGALCWHTYWSHFSPEKWADHPDRRASMTEDLLEKHPLEGMTEDEVTTLLGENDNDRGYFVEEDRSVYWLGDRRTAIDSEWLLIDFENGVVDEYNWTTD